ncbi:hypothetical protein [Ruminococcus bicirculans (ex Wegman et al. 2014)]|uniref:hypothetical protein n=1 Tax=Ruminococcus bicirculans (ex Wegman et al. 2014) TaxID=1160721 RepID=UPI001A9A5CFF
MIPKTEVMQLNTIFRSGLCLMVIRCIVSHTSSIPPVVSFVAELMKNRMGIAI